MKRSKDIKKKRSFKRRLIQLYAALLFNAHLRGFIEGEIYTGKTKIVCTPGLNCYSCPGAVGSCPLGALQNALAASGKRTGFYLFGIMLLYGLIFGRTICGWLCPMGLIQELLHKIPTFKIPKSRVTWALSYLKYVILAVFVIAVPLWYGLWHDLPLPSFCKYICPAGTLEGAVSLISNIKNNGFYGMLGALFTGKAVIMLVIGLMCVFCYRAFCRFLCPLGAIYSLFNRFALIGVKVDKSRCSGCGNCVRHCSMDIRHVGDHECIHCGKCMDFCARDAISLKAGKITRVPPKSDLADRSLQSGKKRQKIKTCVGAAALALLIFALIWFNFIDPAADHTKAELFNQQSSAASETVVTGYEPGQYLADFSVITLDQKRFTLSEQKGKVVFINLWGTYCTPCVQELPLFDALYREHREDVEVIAVHSSIITEDISAFLSDKGWTIPFAVDTEDDLVWKTVGGTSSMPQTIVIDPDGKVRFNRHGSVTKELLNTFYQQAKANDADI